MKKHIYLIDYLKAVSILMVIITHYAWEDKINAWFLFGINMAVPIFMLVSGYNFSASNLRKTGGKLKEMYDYKVLFPKIIRFTRPFACIFVLEIILKMIKGEKYSLADIALRFFEGGYGPGSYYYPIMMQLLLVFPIIYLLVSKLKWIGVLLAAQMNFVYEVVIHRAEVEVEDYRLMVFRYLFYIALGCYLFFYLKDKIPKIVLLLMMAVGSGYLVAVYYFDYEPRVFTYWTRTCMVTALYIFPVIYYCFRHYMDFKISGKIGEALSEIGKASYHIFLVQMVYYHFEFGAIFGQLAVPLQVIGNVLFCLTVGYLFYYLENRGISGWKEGIFTYPQINCVNFVKNKGNVS